MIDFGALFRALAGSEVRFVLVGGVAATLHGSARLTQDVDIVYARVGEIAGAGNYDSVIAHTIEVELFGTRCRCIALPTLIEAKVAAGRPKDLEAIAELRALLQERGKGE